MGETGDLWKEHFLLGMTQPSFSSPAVLLINKDLHNNIGPLAFCQKKPEGGGLRSHSFLLQIVVS